MLGGLGFSYGGPKPTKTPRGAGTDGTFASPRKYNYCTAATN